MTQGSREPTVEPVACEECSTCSGNGVRRDGYDCTDCEGTGCRKHPFCDEDHEHGPWPVGDVA
jgi:hypothetical protein